MSDIRKHYLSMIEDERVKQLAQFGSEWDRKNTPNDWGAIASKYMFSAASNRLGVEPPQKDYVQDQLIKAAAVILAALEHLDTMVENGTLN